MKPTQEQVIAWLSEATKTNGDVVRTALALAYEAGRKDENEACAKVCELIAINAADTRAAECAVGIRARREQ